MAKKVSDGVRAPAKIGWPCIASSGGVSVLGICVSIDSKVCFGEDPPMVEEVTVWTLAQRVQGRPYFEPLLDQGQLIVEASEVSSVYTSVNLASVGMDG